MPPAGDATAIPGRPGLLCDFCGERVPSVRRIAIDEGYERLQTPHKERYACPACSARKEQERLGLGRPPA